MKGPTKAVFSHITLGTNDISRAITFYDAVMGTLGHRQLFNAGTFVAYGELTGTKLYIVPPFDGKPAKPGNGVHAAFIAQTRSQVDAFYSTALAHGGTDEGPPGLRPHYHANYYGAYVRDPDGNKIQAVCHKKFAA